MIYEIGPLNTYCSKIPHFKPYYTTGLWRDTSCNRIMLSPENNLLCKLHISWVLFQRSIYKMRVLTPLSKDSHLIEEVLYPLSLLFLLSAFINIWDQIIDSGLLFVRPHQNKKRDKMPPRLDTAVTMILGAGHTRTMGQLWGFLTSDSHPQKFWNSRAQELGSNYCTYKPIKWGTMNREPWESYISALPDNNSPFSVPVGYVPTDSTNYITGNIFLKIFL